MCAGQRLNLLPRGNLHGQISGQLWYLYLSIWHLYFRFVFVFHLYLRFVFEIVIWQFAQNSVQICDNQAIVEKSNILCVMFVEDCLCLCNSAKSKSKFVNKKIHSCCILLTIYFCLLCLLQKWENKQLTKSESIFRQLCIRCHQNNAKALHG